MKQIKEVKNKKIHVKWDPFKIIVVVALGVLFFNVNHMQKQKVEVNTTKEVAAKEKTGSVQKNELLVSATNFDYNNYVSLDEARALIGSYTLTATQKLQWYPVGSIYMSTSATNPASLFGGTWVAWGTGRTPAGINTSDGNYNTVEKTGGTSSETLSVAQMPSHTHGFSGSAVNSGGNSVTPYASFSGSAVTSSGSSASLTASFSGSAGNTGNNSAGHTHRYGTGASSAGGNHNHGFGMYNSGREAGGYGVEYGGANRFWGRILVNRGSWYPGGNFLDIQGNHSHWISGTTDGINTNHTHTITPSGTVSISNTTHTHSITPRGNVSIYNTAHTHSVTGAGSNSYNGSGQAHNNLQPYITCYMWKRTA